MLQLRTPGSSRIVLIGTPRDVLEGKEHRFLIICKGKIKSICVPIYPEKGFLKYHSFPSLCSLAMHRVSWPFQFHEYIALNG